MDIFKEPALVSLVNDGDSVKSISATDKDGIVRSAAAQSLHVDDDGNLRYFELLEHSEINKALIHSLWFNKAASVLIVSPPGANAGHIFEVRGRPIRALITGDEFESSYRSVRDIFGEKADLSTVWVIRPDEINDLRYETQRERHDARHPFAIHLDRLTDAEPAEQVGGRPR
jgi:hypothetical protein